MTALRPSGDTGGPGRRRWTREMGADGLIRRSGLPRTPVTVAVGRGGIEPAALLDEEAIGK